MKLTKEDKNNIKRYWKIMKGGSRRLRKKVFGTKRSPTKRGLLVARVFRNKELQMQNWTNKTPPPRFAEILGNFGFSKDSAAYYESVVDDWNWMLDSGLIAPVKETGTRLGEY